MQVPANLNARLRDYQREGVKFLYSLYRQEKGGILADGMLLKLLTHTYTLTHKRKPTHTHRHCTCTHIDSPIIRATKYIYFYTTDMGLGKTIQTIAFVTAILNKGESPYFSAFKNKGSCLVIVIVTLQRII